MIQTVQTLIEELRHPHKQVRSPAAIELGRLKDPQTIDALIGAMSIEEDVLVREDMVWALVRLQEHAFDRVMALATHPSAMARHAAVHTLGKFGDVRAVDVLLGALNDESSQVVVKAAYALGQLEAVEAIPALVRLLGKQPEELKDTLNYVLENFGAASIPSLIDALGAPEASARAHAIDILALLRAKDAIPAIIDRLVDESANVRFSAVSALGQMRNLDIRPLIEPLANDPDERIRLLVAEMLRRLKK
jgi:HEAT repeat protein